MVHKLGYYSLLVVVALLLGNCGPGYEPTKQQKVTKLLTKDGGQWEPAATSNAITLEGIDVQDELFPGFTITFTANQIVTSGTSPVWPANDSWSFKDKNAEVLIRASDGKEITIVEISSSQLIIQLTWDQTTYGDRTMSLPGLYQFILNK